MFATPGIRAILGVVFTWMLAHNLLYTYIAPFVAQAGLGDQVDRVLLTFGVASLAGIWITGRIVDHSLRRAVLVSSLPASPRSRCCWGSIVTRHCCSTWASSVGA